MAIIAALTLALALFGPQGIRSSTGALADSSPVTGLRKDAHPVILVHGWTGEPMESTGALLEKSMGDSWQFLLYDYSATSLLWAGDPRVFKPLADYIKRVSKQSRSVGGDGLVYLVAHSMGGLAIRFAANEPGVAAAIGGVVSVGTPHAGSPWGNAADGLWGALAEGAKGRFTVPSQGSLARICLAPHKGGAGLPAGCRPPPYLPPSIALQQIAGQVTVERKYFGLPAYDVPVGGDGIVPTSSANGYIGSASKKNLRGSFGVDRVECRLSDNTLASVAVGSVAVPWQLFTDAALIGQLMDQKAGLFAATLLGRIMMASDSCSHMAMMTNAPVVKQLAKSLRFLAARHEPMTMDGLKSVRVPSLCDHKPGQLQDGVLTGNGRNGDVALIPRFSKIGLEIPGRADGAVAAIACSQGGIGWPDKVVFYNNVGVQIGLFDSGDVGARPGRQKLDSVVLDGSRVRIGVTAVPLSGDNELWGTSRAEVTYEWDEQTSRMTRARVLVSEPDPLGRRLAQALGKRDRATVGKLAPDALSPILFPSDAVTRVGFEDCIGMYSNNGLAQFISELGERACLIKYVYPGGVVNTYMAFVRLGDDKSWRITRYQWIED